MDRNYFTLQLSMPALERLMQDAGEDFVVNLRQSVIQQFCDAKIKGLMGKATEHAIEAAIAKTVGGLTYYGEPSLKPEFKKKIGDAAKKAVDSAMKAELDNLENSIRSYITAEIEKQHGNLVQLVANSVSKQFKQEVDEEVAKVIEKMMKAAKR